MNDKLSRESLAEQGQVAPNESGVNMGVSAETTVSKMLEAAQPTTQLPNPQAPPTNLPDPVQDAVPQAPSQSVQPQSVNPGVGGATPAIADDADLIEKEWVVRAKHIVEQTRQDPYIQNQEVNKMKAEYIKKRYGRDIKLAP